MCQVVGSIVFSLVEAGHDSTRGFEVQRNRNVR
ncbi:hypothetical protein V1591_22980 (plasmid) [Enterobacter roggenkampii]